MSFSDWLKRYAPPLLMMVAITVASSRPGHALPDMSFQFSDKLAHAAVFFVLGVLWARALPNSLRGAGVAIALCVAFGAADELHQSTVPGRFPDVFDALADTVGGVLGVASFRRWRATRPDDATEKETHGDHPQLSRQDPSRR